MQKRDVLLPYECVDAADELSLGLVLAPLRNVVKSEEDVTKYISVGYVTCIYEVNALTPA